MILCRRGCIVGGDVLIIKARGESQSKECLEKQTKISHTLAHLDQVA
jgi:hypothetical protein